MTFATTRVKQAFIEAGTPLTLTEIRTKTELASNKISMILAHFNKMGMIQKEMVVRDQKGRKNVWLYTFTEKVKS